MVLAYSGGLDTSVILRWLQETDSGRSLFNAAPEPKEGWFVPEAGHEDLAHYGGLDAAVAFIERRLGG